MATNNSKTPELFPIEKLQINNNTPQAVFQGVKASEGWKTGKVVSDDEYKKAINSFLKKPMNGKEVKKDAKRR